MALALGHGRNSSWDPMKVRAVAAVSVSCWGNFGTQTKGGFPCVIGNLVFLLCTGTKEKETTCVIGNFGGKV